MEKIYKKNIVSQNKEAVEEIYAVFLLLINLLKQQNFNEATYLALVSFTSFEDAVSLRGLNNRLL